MDFLAAAAGPSAGGEDLTHLYRGFACPQDGLDEEFVEAITVEYGREVTRQLVGRFGDDLDPGLIAYLSRWTEQDSDFETVWNLTFGAVHGATLLGRPQDTRVCAAALGLRLGARGVSGHWHQELGRSAALLWDRWLLPPADAIAVDSDGTQARIRISSDRWHRNISLTRGPSGWACESGQPLPQFGPLQRMMTVLPRRAIVTPDFDDLRPMLADNLGEAMTTMGQRALDMLGKHAPIYQPWVERVIRHLVPLRFDKSCMRSGSHADQPGVIHISYDERAIVLAEMLVHEATHQYMHLLCRLGDIDDGTDTKLYYSPVRRTDRPLSAIVVAYHAFANVLLFYRLCQQSGAPDEGYCAAEEIKLISQLRELEQVLKRADALTDIGRALCDPLMERIA